MYQDVPRLSPYRLQPGHGLTNLHLDLRSSFGFDKVGFGPFSGNLRRKYSRDG